VRRGLFSKQPSECRFEVVERVAGRLVASGTGQSSPVSVFDHQDMRFPGDAPLLSTNLSYESMP
jgi:hypothetical protein